MYLGFLQTRVLTGCKLATPECRYRETIARLIHARGGNLYTYKFRTWAEAAPRARGGTETYPRIGFGRGLRRREPEVSTLSKLWADEKLVTTNIRTWAEARAAA